VRPRLPAFLRCLLMLLAVQTLVAAAPSERTLVVVDPSGTTVRTVPERARVVQTTEADGSRARLVTRVQYARVPAGSVDLIDRATG